MEKPIFDGSKRGTLNKNHVNAKVLLQFIQSWIGKVIKMALPLMHHSIYRIYHMGTSFSVGAGETKG